jgi:peptidoglycan/xylan/chitin deacetylase (PgdA/CDA1 family)
MTEYDLARCAERGHEIASHTFSHVRCPDLDRAALLAECRRGAEALGAFAPTDFAYPFGATDARVKRLIGSGFDSCRGIQPGINGLATDLNDLKANAIYSAAGLDRHLKLIEENARIRGWLIFYTHDVGTSPSPFGATPEDLERLTAAVRRAGLRVATIRGVLEELGLPTSAPPSGSSRSARPGSPA